MQRSLKESSPNTLHGSFTPDLSISKLWLANKVKSIQNNFNSIYILGSWFGNMAIFLDAANIKALRIVNVDINDDWLQLSKRLHNKLDLPYALEYMSKDANKLDYRQIKQPGLVINTSCNDMSSNGWFDNIPAGTLVALQARNNVDATAVNAYSSLNDFVTSYQLANLLYRGYLDLKDPEVEYRRFMVIGVK